jgi:hypothetical protein
MRSDSTGLLIGLRGRSKIDLRQLESLVYKKTADQLRFLPGRVSGASCRTALKSYRHTLEGIHDLNAVIVVFKSQITALNSWTDFSVDFGGILPSAIRVLADAPTSCQ